MIPTRFFKSLVRAGQTAALGAVLVAGVALTSPQPARALTVPAVALASLCGGGAASAVAADSGHRTSAARRHPSPMPARAG